MTLLGKLITFFPFFIYTLVFVVMGQAILSQKIIYLFLILIILYLLPVIVFRIHNIFFPLRKVVVDLDSNQYISWWGSYKIQRVYYDLPFLESLLRSVPGVYSFWLRLWGSKIGRGVYWPPRVEICDRSLVEIGDYVVFGHEVVLSSHTLAPVKSKHKLVVEKIKIENNCFIGAHSRIGPGCSIAMGSFLPFETLLKVRQNWSQ